MLTGIATWLLNGWLSRWALTAEGEIKDGWRWLTASPVHFLGFALVLSLGCNVWLWRGWDREKAGRHSDAVAFQQVMDASRANVASLKAAKATEDARQALNTRRTDDATEPARTAALAAADAYARAHRCMRTPEAVAAANGQPGGNLPGASAAAGGAEAQGEAVAIPEWGVNNCALNTADLQKAYEWAQKTWATGN